MENIHTITLNRNKIINDFSTFEEWVGKLRKFRSVNTMKPVVFDLAEFSFHENVNLTTRVDYYSRSNYGKKTQGCFTTLALLFMLIDFTVSSLSGKTFSDYALLLDFGIVLFAALTGKVTGLVYAHICLLRLARRIRKRLVCVYTIKPELNGRHSFKH